MRTPEPKEKERESEGGGSEWEEGSREKRRGERRVGREERINRDIHKRDGGGGRNSNKKPRGGREGGEKIKRRHDYHEMIKEGPRVRGRLKNCKKKRKERKK